jgi:hypothetical protein
MACLLLLLSITNARAHTFAMSFLSIDGVTESSVAAKFDVHIRDLHHLLNLDRDGNAAVTWGELSAAGKAIEALVLSRTQLRTADGACTVSARDAMALAEHSDGVYAHLSLTLACASAATSLQVDDSRWFEVDPNHRSLLEFTAANGVRTQTLLNSATPEWRMTESTLARALRFLREGAVHLITGYDHLAFLSVLLLALVRRRSAEPPAALAIILRRAFVVITSFTIAHSLTLLLAATGRLSLPSQPVEVAIAASVVIAACLNLSRSAGRHGWALAFAFGLVHGLGFAGALAELASERIDLLALAAFNIGIELAQVACALAVVPLMWWVFRNARFERVVLPLASMSIAAVAASWVFNRLDF